MIAGLVRLAETAVTVALYPTTWTLSVVAELIFPDVNDDPFVQRQIEALDKVCAEVAGLFDEALDADA